MSSDISSRSNQDVRRRYGSMPSARSSRESSNFSPHHEGPAFVIRDHAGWLSAVGNLKPHEVVVLLTPLVVPISHDPTDTADPFEPFGRALAVRHSKIRHVSYTNRNGITSTHVGIMVRASLVIFVICNATSSTERHVDIASIARIVSANRPLIVVLCCEPGGDILHREDEFPTIIQSRGYSRPCLEATAALMFGEMERHHLTADGFSPALLPMPHPPILQPPIPQTPVPQTPVLQTPQPIVWPVVAFDESRDMLSVSTLWNQAMENNFVIDSMTLGGLLKRPGYCRHYCVRDPESEQLLGFCATYLTYVDHEGDKLIGSIALLITRASHLKQGVGLSLHNHAYNTLKKTRGVVRVQLGSTFPRLLYGPTKSQKIDSGWLERRGWKMDSTAPGQGRPVYDMLVNLVDWRPPQKTATDTISIRECGTSDTDNVLAMVEEFITREDKMGWFDQYSKLVENDGFQDIMIAVEKDADEKESVIGTAITYGRTLRNPIAMELPWAGQLGRDVGGITCICVLPSKREILGMGLVEACVHKLKSQGMNRVFLDGVTEGMDKLRRLGFQDWAQYKDVWQDV